MKSVKTWILALIVVSCIQPFELESERAVERIVIESEITNKKEAYITQISRTVSGDDHREMVKVTGASVCFEDELGNCYEAKEEKSGIYATDTSSFIAETGMSYRLLITLANGEELVSNYQTLKAAEPVPPTRLERSTIQALLGSSIVEETVVDVIADEGTRSETNYSRYSFVGEYAFRTIQQGSIECFREEPDEAPPADIICYNRESNAGFLNVYSNESFTIGSEVSHTIFVFRYNFKVARNYNLTITRHTIDQEAFQFFDQLRRQQEQGGTLFESPPSGIVGNIDNVTNPEGKPLGFFLTSSESSFRTNILPSLFRINAKDSVLYPECYPDSIPGRGGPYQLPQPKPFAFCCDCRLYPGAFTDQPSNWIQ
ncbi:MAG: DUF4249 domain-containing protein [Cyclobacteriaceae bacterium]